MQVIAPKFMHDCYNFRVNHAQFYVNETLQARLETKNAFFGGDYTNIHLIEGSNMNFHSFTFTFSRFGGKC